MPARPARSLQATGCSGSHGRLCGRWCDAGVVTVTVRVRGVTEVRVLAIAAVRHGWQAAAVASVLRRTPSVCDIHPQPPWAPFAVGACVSTHSMKRQWTDESRDAWIRRRIERRKREQGKDSHKLREKSLEREKYNIQKALRSIVTSQAWELQKHPTEPYPAPFAGTLHLPLGYMREEEIIIKVKEGNDLNYVVHQFYDCRPDPDYQGTNFVSTNGIAARRHEFMGPAPLVAGYRFDDTARTIRVEWWDPCVKQMWIGRDSWKITTYFDEVIGGYVSCPRGDFDCSDDVDKYFGLTHTSDPE